MPTFINLGASANPDINDAIDKVIYSGTSWTPPTYGVIALWVYSRASGNESPNPQGNGIVWYKMASALTGDDTLTFFVGDPTNATTGVPVISFVGTQIGCVGSYIHVSGTYTGNGVTGSVAQLRTGAAGSGLSLDLNFTNATGTTGNSRPAAGFIHRANEATAPRTNWVEADDMAGVGPTRGVETQWRQSAWEGTASASWASTSANIGIAVEFLHADDFPAGGGDTFNEAVAIAKVVSLVDARTLNMQTAVSLSAVKVVSDSPQQNTQSALTLAELLAMTDVPQIGYQVATPIDIIKAMTDANSLNMQTATTISQVRTVSDSPLQNMQAALTVAEVLAILTNGARTFDSAVDLSRVHTIVATVLSSFQASLPIAKVLAIAPTVVQTLYTLVALDKDVSITVTELSVTFTTKGYVLTLDFSQSPVAVTSFKASASATADHEASSTSASSTKANSSSATDLSASDVEATDL